MVGAPRPAGRIAKFRCGGCASGRPTRPITVPPVTLEPTLRGFSSIVAALKWIGPAPSELNSSNPGRPWLIGPPGLFVLPVRSGSAKALRREFSVFAGPLGDFAGVLFLAGRCTRLELSPAVAGAWGRASFAGPWSLKSFAPNFACRGTAWTCSIEPRCEYVYWLPYASCRTRYLPRVLLRPVFLTTPSLTATTGASTLE